MLKYHESDIRNHCPRRARRGRQDHAGRCPAVHGQGRRPHGQRGRRHQRLRLRRRGAQAPLLHRHAASCTSSTRASTSTCSTPPATPTSSAPPCEALNAVETAVDRRLGRQRHRGQHPPHVPRGRQARAGPAHRHQQARRRQHPLPRAARRHPARRSARSACCSTSRTASGPTSSGVVSVLDPPDKAPAGCPVDLAAVRTAAGRRRRRVRRGADGEVPDRGRPVGRRSWSAAVAKAVDGRRPSCRSSAPAAKKDIGVDRTARRPGQVQLVAVARQGAAGRPPARATTGTSTTRREPTRAASSSAQVFKTRQRQVRRQPELHPRLLRQARRRTSRCVNAAHRQDGPRSAAPA